MVRPSLKSTHILSVSKCTRVALAEEVIPCLCDSVLVTLYDLQQLPQGAGIITIIVGHSDLRYQPEFRFQGVFLNMDVYGFTRRPFVRIKEKVEAAMTEDDRMDSLYREPFSTGNFSQ